VAQFTLVSTREAFSSATVVAPDAEGYYCYWRTILDDLSRFPWNQQPMNHAFALQAVMRKFPEANMMLNASVRIRTSHYLVVSRNCAIVHGTLVRVE